MMHPVAPADVDRMRGGLDSHRLANVVNIEFGSAPRGISIVRIQDKVAVVLPDPLYKKDADSWTGSATELAAGLKQIPDGFVVVLAGPCVEDLVDRRQPGVDAFRRTEVGSKPSAPGVISTDDVVYYDGWISSDAPVKRNPNKLIRRQVMGYRMLTHAPWRDFRECRSRLFLQVAENPSTLKDVLRWTPGNVYNIDLELLLDALETRFSGLPGTTFVTSFSGPR
jgi:hypothetical protein